MWKIYDIKIGGIDIKEYFNELIYNKSKIIIPIVLISLIIGILIGVFFKHIKINIGIGIMIILFIDVLLIIYNLINKDIDTIIDNKIFKSYYWMINIICYCIILYINSGYLYKMFRGIDNKYIPKEIYILLICTGLFIIMTWMLYIILFSNVKKTKITTSGLELEFDDMPLSSKQNEVLNNIQDCIENARIVNLEMDKYVSKFIIEDLIDDNNSIKEEYNYKKLFTRLREFSNEIVKNNENSIVVDFKSIEELENIKEEYDIPNNLYNKIDAEIKGCLENKSSIFIERNLVFVNYKITSIVDERLIENRIIGIIEFKNIKEGYIGYGSILLISLKMFDYICAMSTIPIYEGEYSDE